MLVVEPVRNSDLDPVVRLAVRTLRERYDPQWLADHLDRRGTFLVARDVPTNQIVGFALAEQREPLEGHVIALAVDPRRRGEGIGRALLGNVREEMTRRGAFRLTLEVRADDSRAQSFYSNQGFWPAGVESGVYSDGEDAVRMERPL